MTEYTRENMPDDLRWLAENVSEWLRTDCNAICALDGGKYVKAGGEGDTYNGIPCYTRAQWQSARRTLGLDQPEVTEAEEEAWREKESKLKETSDGSTASYYQLPKGATELYHLIIHKNMNAQLGEIFRAAYRYGQSSHSDQLRDARKIKAYIEQEIERLENKCIG